MIEKNSLMNINKTNQSGLKNTPASWGVDLIFLALALGGLFFILLGTRPLFTPDEGRYAEIAREMVAAQDYVTPHLNSIKYFEKPPLFYWLGAAAIKWAGVDNWSVRSVNAVLALIGCLLTYVTARYCYDRLTGLIAAFVLGTSLLYFIMAHMVSLDLPVTVFVAASLYAFLIGARTPPGKKRYFCFLTAASAAALAVLTKGLIGLVFPIVLIVTWLIYTGEWRALKNYYLPSCIFIFLLIALPWHILVGWRNPEFFYFYIIEQHFLRYTLPEIGHYEPIWFFIPIFLLGLFPWIVFLPQTIAAHVSVAWKERRTITNITSLFFLAWAGLVFLFFSFSKSKLIPYILPMFPPLAILIGHYLAQTQQHQRGIKMGCYILVLLSFLIAGAFYWYLRHTPLPDAVFANHFLTWASIILVIGYSTACFIAQKRIAVLVITTSLFLLTGLTAIPGLESRNIYPLALTLKTILKPSDDVITYNRYYQDLPFYIEQRVSILNWRNELRFGMQHQDTRAWMINTPLFWTRWFSHQRVFVILSKEDYQHFVRDYPKANAYLIDQTFQNVLISNQLSNKTP